MAVSRGGVFAPGGVSAAGGWCLLPGGCLLLGGGGVCSAWVSAPGGCACSRGVSAPGGGLLPEGVCLLPGGGVCSQGGVVPYYALRQTPPPFPCGQTDACKNITFTTSLRTITRFSRTTNNIHVQCWHQGFHSKNSCCKTSYLSWVLNYQFLGFQSNILTTELFRYGSLGLSS